MRNTILLLLFIGLLIFIIFATIASILRQRQLKNLKQEEKKKYKGIINKMNHNDVVNGLGKIVKDNKLEKIFNRAKNPWRMTIPTFQFIRFGGLILFTVVGLACMAFLPVEYALFIVALGVLCWYYPMYYYKAIGDEREAEWNKMYEFVWVIKHNVMLYDPAKAYMETKVYIQKHAPHNEELIQGFDDFYRYWSPDGIDPYIERFYPFSVTREITQIIYNMHVTGEFPEDELNNLRQFIINAQNLTVEKTLSAVSGKATIFSLPFLMVSVIVALMIPLLFQIMEFF